LKAGKIPFNLTTRKRKLSPIVCKDLKAMTVKAKSTLACRNAVQVKVFIELIIAKLEVLSGNRRTWTFEDLKRLNVKALFQVTRNSRLY